LNNNKLLNGKLICAFRWSVLSSIILSVRFYYMGMSCFCGCWEWGIGGAWEGL